MWVSNYIAQNAVRWGHNANYENFEEQVRIRSGNCMDGTWAKGMLYLPQWANPIVNRYNDAGQNVGAIQMPFPVYGMAVDVENDWFFFLNPNDGMSIYVYELTDHGGLGDQIGVIRNHAQFHGNAVAYNLEWVPQHREGQLWITNAQTGRVHQIAVDTDNWQCTEEVQSFAVFPQADQPYSAVAHDGHNLWAAGYIPGNIRIYDDGIYEANWLRIAPMAGVVAPDEEQVVTVTLDTHGLLGGEYSAELHIRSNDPENPEEVILVEMTGYDWNWDWDWWFTWPDANGYPDVMDFDETFVGGTCRIIAEARNLGTEALVIDEILADNEAFSVQPNRNIVLEPGEEIEILFLFTPEETEEYSATFTLETNDPFYGDWEISTSGEGIPAPRMRIIGEDIEEFPWQGEVIEHEIIIANDGGNPLRYEIDVENIVEPQRDRNSRSLRSVDGTSDPLRDDPGDILDEFEWRWADAVNYKGGIEYLPEEDLVFLTSYSWSACAVVDPNDDYRVVDEWQLRNFLPMDVASLNGIIYIVENANPWRVGRYDIEGNSIGALELDFLPACIAAIPELQLLMIGEIQNSHDLHLVTPDGEQVSAIPSNNYRQYTGGQYLYNICWVSAHIDGNLWVNTPGTISQLNVDTENWRVTGLVQLWQTNVATPTGWDGVGHDGHNIIYSAYSLNNYRVYDDGVQEANWLAVAPMEGVVAPDDEQVITITLDTDGLLGGFYSAELHIRSNDPENPEEVINVEMTGNDWNQDGLFWDPEEGRIEFPPTFNGGGSIVAITAFNASARAFTVSEVRIEGECAGDYSVDPWEAVIEPGERFEFELLFAPTDVGERPASMTFVVDGPEQFEVVYELTGTGVVPPRIEVTPAELVNDFEFTVHNRGGSTLVVDSIYFEGESGAEFITPNSFEVDPDGEQTVEIDLVFPLDDQYWEIYEIVIFSNDPEQPAYVVEAEYFDGNGGGVHYPGIEPTDSNHSVLITAFEIDGEPVPPRWEIGVFTPGGAWCGAVVWMGRQEGLAVWGADDNHEDYFHDGEVMTFRGYDRRSRQEYQLVASVEEGGLIWHDEGLTILSLHNAPPGRDFPLRQGWNLFSLNLIPSVEMREGSQWVEDLFSQLARANGGEHHVLLMKDQDGHFWRPANHFNNIPRWNPEQGYQICIDEEFYPEWFGIPINPQAQIRLRQGWNIAPYYPEYQLPANRASRNYVISPIIDYVLMAKDMFGNFMIPSRDYFSNMAPWREGQAYQIKVSEAVILNYPAEQQMQVAELSQPDDKDLSAELKNHFHTVTLTGSNMSVLLTLEPEQTSIQSIEIGVFTSNGLCVGNSKFITLNSEFQIGLAVWGDDPSTESIDGAVEGEALTFRLWDGQKETNVKPTWEPYDRRPCLYYETDSFASGVISQTGMSDLPDQITLFPPSPNPFNSTTRIWFALPSSAHAKMTLFDNAGRSIRVSAEEDFSAGTHFLSLDAGNLPAGIYFVRLDANGDAILQKVIITK